MRIISAILNFGTQVRADITEEIIDEFYRVYKEAYNNMADFRNKYLKAFFPDDLTYLTIIDVHERLFGR